MADDRLNLIMQDLQEHLQNANLKVTNLSSIAQKGDEKLVEQFMSESIFVPNSVRDKQTLATNAPEVLASQMYIACFWGFKDVVKGILEISKQQDLGVDVNHQNKGTSWTPLHAACFQEHGPIVMMLLENGADPNLEDSEGRSPKDFASASNKVWGHFATLGMSRTSKALLSDMGILKATRPGSSVSPRDHHARSAGQGIKMADYGGSRESSENDPYSQEAVTGDVLANEAENTHSSAQQPRFNVYK